MRPIPSRQTSTTGLSQSQQPNLNLPIPAGDPAPEDQILFNMSSNMLVGAGGHAPPQPTNQPPTMQVQQTSHPTRPDLIRNITQSTSQMAHYAAQLTARQAQVPGVTYTFNPTAREFAPSSSEGKSEE